MGKKKSQAGYKIRHNHKKNSKRKKGAKKSGRNKKQQLHESHLKKEKVEKSLADICSNLCDLEIAKDRKLNQTANIR